MGKVTATATIDEIGRGRGIAAGLRTKCWAMAGCGKTPNRIAGERGGRYSVHTRCTTLSTTNKNGVGTEVTISKDLHNHFEQHQFLR